MEPGSSKQAQENGFPDQIRGENASCSLSSRSSSSRSDPLKDFDEDENDILSPSSKESSQQASPSSSRPGRLILPEPPSRTPEWSMISASPRTGPAPFLLSEIQNQSPPLQSMGGPPTPEYDPSRIPSSVFATKPASSPMDWSVASNESLFSIHMGNNSFSKDHIGKSGELYRFDDQNSSPFSLPTVDEESTMVNAKDIAEGGHGRKDDSPPAEGVRLSVCASNVSAANARSSASTARHSEASGASRQSFAFPVLSGEGGRTSMKAASKSSKSKPPEEAAPKTEAPEVTPKEPETRWYSWLCCWPRCCG